MKKLLAPQTFVGKHTLQASGLAALAAVLAGAFWAVTASSSLAAPGPPLCTVCHKRTSTQQYPCNSLEYRRHVDHGDQTNACATPTSSDSARRIDSVQESPALLLGK
jgi:hypothetical protein